MSTTAQRTPDQTERPDGLIGYFIASLLLAGLTVADLVLVIVRESDAVWVVCTAVATAATIALAVLLFLRIRHRSW
jgi:hypothetical protein